MQRKKNPRKEKRPKRTPSYYEPFSQRAFDEIIKPNTLLIRSIAGRFQKTLPDVDNTVQEIHLRILKDADKFDPFQESTGWVATVSKRVCQDLAIKEKRQTRLFLAYMPELAKAHTKRRRLTIHETPEINRKKFGRIMHAANKLIPDQKETFIRKAILGHTFERISRELKVPIGTVKARYYDALKKIKNKLSKE